MNKNILHVFFIASLFIAVPGFAEDERSNISVRDEQYAQNIEQIKLGEKDAARKEGVSTEEFRFRYGGWVTSTYRYYKNIDNEEIKEDFLKWSWQQDIYLWASLKYRESYAIYFRLADSYIERGTGQAYTGIGNDNEGPYISAAYLQVDLEPEHQVPAKFTLGRQYLFLGRGVVYADINDGILLETSADSIYQKFFFAKTRPHQDNIDFSVPGFDKNGDRLFAGGEMAYTGFSKTTVYVMGLYQKDLADPDPGDGAQLYHYNSYYYGGGFTTQPVDRLEVWSEIIIERGTGFTDTVRVPLKETNIEAWGWLSGANYHFDAPTRPVAQIEFARGTGDGQRARVTNTFTGGDNDGEDRNFLYFGYYLAGYAFNPRLSNINILSVGGSFQPLSEIECLPMFKKMALGSKYYFYRKDEQRAGTSDFESTDNDADVGQEWDIYLHWQVMDQLRASLRYGIFYPGEAFPEATNDNTEFFSASITYSF